MDGNGTLGAIGTAPLCLKPDSAEAYGLTFRRLIRLPCGKLLVFHHVLSSSFHGLLNSDPAWGTASGHERHLCNFSLDQRILRFLKVINSKTAPEFKIHISWFDSPSAYFRSTGREFETSQVANIWWLWQLSSSNMFQSTDSSDSASIYSARKGGVAFQISADFHRRS